MLEDIPRHGLGFAEELPRVGSEIKAAAEKELTEFYPTDADGSKPISYIWARTMAATAEHVQVQPAEILLVEDNPGDIRLVQEALRESKIDARMPMVAPNTRPAIMLRSPR